MVQQARLLMENAFAMAMHATCCGIHHSFRIAPGVLVYQQDMFLDLLIIADLLTIQDKWQVLIDENLRQQNVKHRLFNYVVSGQMLVKTIAPSKLQPWAIGPFLIQQLYTNGDVTIQHPLRVTKRINIWQIIWFKAWTNRVFHPNSQMVLPLSQIEFTLWNPPIWSSFCSIIEGKCARSWVMCSAGSLLASLGFVHSDIYYSSV